jgi:septal ring factor EnvC (AmiA/AmiB activator)
VQAHLHPVRWRARVTAVLVLAAALAGTPPALDAQAPTSADEDRTRAFAERVAARIATLESEADALAAQVRTLLEGLQALEQDQAREAARVADAAVDQAQAALDDSSARLAELEARRLAEAPEIAARLVEIYKQGRGGDVRMLLGVSGVRDLGRAARTLAALTEITEQRLEEHRRTVAAARDDAQRARDTAARAVAARDALLDDLDEQRDLNAELTGALQLAAARLDQQLVDLAAGRPVRPVDVPLGPFRGALAWPAPGAVQYAGAFAGFGTLVIVDHGAGALSLYGDLASTGLAVGERVDAGAPVGTTGEAPGGAPSLYFELRVDGRSVDPIEWLQTR